ncbi:MAG TPA: BrnT family toxin [Chloroflexota bacterium]
MSDNTDDYEGFEWDAAKRHDATFASRGLDFEAAARVFADDYLEREDTRRDYGERRYLVTGEVDGRVITVVWTPRSGRRRIISARRASDRERSSYRDHREEIERRDPSR